MYVKWCEQSSRSSRNGSPATEGTGKMKSIKAIHRWYLSGALKRSRFYYVVLQVFPQRTLYKVHGENGPLLSQILPTAY